MFPWTVAGTSTHMYQNKNIQKHSTCDSREYTHEGYRDVCFWPVTKNIARICTNIHPYLFACYAPHTLQVDHNAWHRLVLECLFWSGCNGCSGHLTTTAGCSVV